MKRPMIDAKVNPTNRPFNKRSEKIELLKLPFRKNESVNE
jgi:hypothetical protein